MVRLSKEKVLQLHPDIENLHGAVHAGASPELGGLLADAVLWKREGNTDVVSSCRNPPT